VSMPSHAHTMLCARASANARTCAFASSCALADAASQVVAIAQWDYQAVRDDGLLQGFRISTWLVVLVQVRVTPPASHHAAKCWPAARRAPPRGRAVGRAAAHARNAAARTHGARGTYARPRGLSAAAAPQVVGALLTAFVIKFAGNVLKTFATVLALLCTCAASTVLFDFTPTPLFGVGVLAVSASIWLYARPSLRAARAAASESNSSEARASLIARR
jgi:hypothetical protein